MALGIATGEVDSSLQPTTDEFVETNARQKSARLRIRVGGLAGATSTTPPSARDSRKIYPFEVVLPKGTVTAEWASVVMVQQIRAISKMRLLELIGAISDESQRDEIERRLLEHLDIEFEEDEEL